MKLLFNACLAYDEDFALVGGEFENTRDVDGRTVRRGEDFFLLLLVAHLQFQSRMAYRRTWNPQCLQLLLVIRARLGAVIRNKDHLLSCVTTPISLSVIQVLVRCRTHIPFFLSNSSVSTVPGKRWSPDHRTPKRRYQSCPSDLISQFYWRWEVPMYHEPSQSNRNTYLSHISKSIQTTVTALWY